MKKLLFLLIATLLIVTSCGENKTPEQRALDEYNKEQSDKKTQNMKHEKYIDSLVNIASGVGEYKYMRTNRLNALEILKKEYPTMSEAWKKIEADIESLN